jgi:hypothetical protein
MLGPLLFIYLYYGQEILTHQKIPGKIIQK